MMKKIFWLLIIFNNSYLFSQQYNFKIYYQKKGDTITLLLDNYDPYPMSFEFSGQPKVENMRSIGEHFKNQYVIEGNQSKLRLAQFVPLDGTKPFAFKKIPYVEICIGNILKTNYDEDYVYDLPYSKGKVFTVIQGYNGKLSHQNENALDFNLPQGTEVTAAREGIVTGIEQNSITVCPDKSCASEGNYVRIIHPDGTIAVYLHLKQNGSKLKVGNKVEKGQVIAISGNTGYSTGPHLHFMVYLPSPNRKNIALKTLFRTGEDEKGKYLLEGNKYKRDY